MNQLSSEIIEVVKNQKNCNSFKKNLNNRFCFTNTPVKKGIINSIAEHTNNSTVMPLNVGNSDNKPSLIQNYYTGVQKTKSYSKSKKFMLGNLTSSLIKFNPQSYDQANVKITTNKINKEFSPNLGKTPLEGLRKIINSKIFFKNPIKGKSFNSSFLNENNSTMEIGSTFYINHNKSNTSN